MGITKAKCLYVCVSAFWPRFSVKAKVGFINWDRKRSSGLLSAFQKRCLSLILQSHSCLDCLTLSTGSGRGSQSPRTANAKAAGKKDLEYSPPKHTHTYSTFLCACVTGVSSVKLCGPHHRIIPCCPATQTPSHLSSLFLLLRGPFTITGVGPQEMFDLP